MLPEHVQPETPLLFANYYKGFFTYYGINDQKRPFEVRKSGADCFEAGAEPEMMFSQLFPDGVNEEKGESLTILEEEKPRTPRESALVSCWARVATYLLRQMYPGMPTAESPIDGLIPRDAVEKPQKLSIALHLPEGESGDYRIRLEMK